MVQINTRPNQLTIRWIQLLTLSQVDRHDQQDHALFRQCDHRYSIG